MPTRLPAIPDPPDEVRLLDPITVYTPDSNRKISLEDVQDLLASMRDFDQMVPGFVYPHPEIAGEWMAADGNRRLFVCRLLSKKFKAIILQQPVTELELIRIRASTNCIRKAMDQWAIADDIGRYSKLANCTQAEAAAQLHLSSSTACKAVQVVEKVASDLKPLFVNQTLAASIAYMLKDLPHELQREISKKAVEQNLKRDAVQSLVDAIRFKAVKKPKLKVLKGKAEGRAITLGLLPTDTTEGICEWFKTIAAKLNKHKDIPPESLGFLFT